MKNKFLAIAIILLISSFGKSYAQNKFNIDYDEIKGTLNQSDKYKKDFGRYHGYELPLYEGETANFALYSNDFNAKIILVNPQGKVFKQSEQSSNGLVSMITPVPISGDWILYVVGNQNDKGKFILRYAFANANAINASSNMDFCSTINFLVAHANAHFMMLQLSDSNKNGLPKLPGTVESFIDSENGSFVNVIDKGTSIQIKKRFDEYVEQLQSCLPDWQKGREIKNGNSYILMQNSDKIKIELECNPVSEQKDKFDLVMKLSK